MTKPTKKGLSALTIGICSPVIALMLALFIALAAVAGAFHETLDVFFKKAPKTADAKTLTAGAQLCEDIVEEGIVLLKNEDNALPLSENEIEKINVFGWAAYDWMTTAFGSGFSNTNLKRWKLFPALEAAGIEYNTDLYNLYKNFYSAKVNAYGMSLDEYRGGVMWNQLANLEILHEPGASLYTDEIKTKVHEFSDVALVVIGRTGSESHDLNSEYQKVQPQINGSTSSNVVNDRHYLQLSKEEEEMIAVAKEVCGKVIVVLNTANPMELGFIDDDGIDAALLVGITGLTGVYSVINVLAGEKIVAPKIDADGNAEMDANGNMVYEQADGSQKVNPSGRTVDTFAYDILGTNPAAVNAGMNGAVVYGSDKGEGNKNYYSAYIDYYEGIYVGYKWYETANAEGFWKDVNNEYGEGYDGVVQYPFGFGLSYTTFEWEVTRIFLNDKEVHNLNNITLGKDDKIEIELYVYNTGKVAGMDVVELYYTAPYTAGGIEKSYVNLGAFVKTGVIEPNSYLTVTLALDVNSMASYDCYDKNKNSFTGYELESGDYQLRLMKNAHEEATMTDKSKTGAVIECNVPNGGYRYETDPVTGNKVENRFTKDVGGKDASIDTADLDGSEEATPVEYLTRENFKMPQKNLRSQTPEALAIAKATEPTSAQLNQTLETLLAYAGLEGELIVGTANGLTLSDMIASDEFGYFKETEVKEWDSEDWTYLVQQMTKAELKELVRNSFFQTVAVASIGKAQYRDLDGPLGLNTRVTNENGSCAFVAYPGATVLAQTWDTHLAYAMGLSVGEEALKAAEIDPSFVIKGWYAPGANIHRNPFCGRSGEYYAEDGLLSGKMAAGAVKGAKDKGLYSYLKHFVANESETQREGLNTFMTEQTLREIYLKPFELAIKEGGGNALMTSMNRVGRVWSGASYGLCTEILRYEWGFKGALVTDWVDDGHSDYMPPYKGIWAGNDLWLANPNTGNAGNYINTDNDTQVALLQVRAKDILYMTVDCENARLAYDPDAVAADLSKGFKPNHIWYLYVGLAEAVFVAGAGVAAFFLVFHLIKNICSKKKATAGGDELSESEHDGGEPPATEV